MSANDKYCLGIDLGGTNVRFVLLDATNQPSEVFQLRTVSGRDELVKQMVCGARKLMADHGLGPEDVLAVGIGSPGPLSPSKGIVIETPNLPDMANMPLRDLVSDGLGIPAALENDANAAAYGEYICGAGRGARDMVLLTLGTGVGSGIVIDGRILHGAHEVGGEIGHMIVHPEGEPCGCGQKGCLERYCSAGHMADRARRMIEQGRTGLLAAKLGQTGRITAKDILEAHLAGDAFATEIWDSVAYYLAIGCVNICRIFDPDRIVLAGGLTNAGEHLIEPLLEHFTRQHWSIADIKNTIELAKLGTDAGAIGAAGVAWSVFGRD